MALYKAFCVGVLLTLLAKESESQPSVCGQSSLNTRIVGGQTALTGNWPWQVSLHTSAHFCGGSLITNEWVLTAAHCMIGFTSNPANLKVYLGRQSQQGTNPNEVMKTVAQVIVHTGFQISTLDNDIALARLSSPVTFNSYISPVCLAASDSTFYSGVNSWVTGWGNTGFSAALPYPQNLMEVEIPVVGNRQCKCSYGPVTITDNMICAGLTKGGKDSCQGDSGGPMVSKQNNSWIQAGIVSFGKQCALPNFPGVYTRVSQYESWINSHITINPPGFITYTSTTTDSDLSVSCSGVPPIMAPTTSTTTTTTTTSNITKPTTELLSTSASSRTTTTTILPQNTAPRPVVCGQAPLNTRIVGGDSLVTDGEWPWMASLLQKGKHVCGGTLVSEDSVLTNANCFSGSPNVSEFTVVLGRLKQNGLNPFEVSFNVSNITMSNLTGSNIALLLLSAKPILNNYIQPICLGNGRTFPVGSTCWASGWSSGNGGAEQNLLEFKTTVVDCGNVSVSNNMCTSQFALQQGDSGGPLMCKQDGSWFQVVVLSFVEISTRQKRQTSMMVFEKLNRFQDFLTQTLGTFLTPTVQDNTVTTNGTVNTTTAATSVMTTSGGTQNYLSWLLCWYLFVLTFCLQLFP